MAYACGNTANDKAACRYKSDPLHPVRGIRMHVTNRDCHQDARRCRHIDGDRGRIACDDGRFRVNSDRR